MTASTLQQRFAAIDARLQAVEAAVVLHCKYRAIFDRLAAVEQAIRQVCQLTYSAAGQYCHLAVALAAATTAMALCEAHSAALFTMHQAINQVSDDNSAQSHPWSH